MACECNFVMLSACIILFLGVASQTLSFALPGWMKFTPAQDVLNGTDVIFKQGKSYSSGLWVECEGDLAGCDNWIEDSFDVAKDVGQCTANKFVNIVPGQRRPVCRSYTNLELTMWVTQALGLFLIAAALVFAILASVAFCCNCCGDCCVSLCKFIVLLISITASMSITCGLVLFGVTFSESDYQKIIHRKGWVIPIKEMELYYSFALSALAACLAFLGAIVAAFSRNDDNKI